MGIFDDTQSVVFENASIRNYNVLVDTISRSQSETIKDTIISIGYFIFGSISLTSLRHTYMDPMLFIKNVLICIAFYGISHTYMYDASSSNMHHFDIVNKIYSARQNVLYNGLIVIYALLSIFYKDTRYHMNVFYRVAVKKPTMFGIEIDGILTLVAHTLLLMTLIYNVTGLTAPLIVSILFIISYSILFVFNLNRTNIKNEWLYSAIFVGSFLLIAGYGYDFIGIMQIARDRY